MTYALDRLMETLKAACESFERENPHGNDCCCRGCAYPRTMKLVVDKYEEDKASGKVEE